MIDENKLIEKLRKLKENVYCTSVYCTSVDSFVTGYCIAIDKAIELAVQADKIENDKLVEKSIPKKPRVIKVYEDVVCYECPNCNSRTPTNFRKNYCDVCGQKLDWREEND